METILVLAFVLASEVEMPVGAEVAAGPDGAQAEDGLGTIQAPASAGDVHPVGDQETACPLDDAGGNRQPVG